MKHTEEKQDKIQLEGIFEKGYGIYAKAVMLDPDLSIQAKGIYAYFCSYSGSNGAIFPGRDRILADLNLSKNGYYKHYKALIDHGYIKVVKKKGYLNRNTYVIVNNPKKLKNATPSNNSPSKLIINGIYSFGYGFIPKAAMVDTCISLKAKALLAYFYVLACSGSCAFPKQKTILFHFKISSTAYYTALNQLIDNGYITTKQRIAMDGKFAVNDYTLNTFEEENKPYVQKEDNGNSDDKSPCIQKEDNKTSTVNKAFSPHIQNKDNVEKCINKNSLPYTQKEDNTALPCVHFGDIENEDNNNSTSINSNISISSIYQEGSNSIKNINADRVMENQADNFDFVYDNGLPTQPYNQVTDKVFMTQCIRKLAMLEEMNFCPTIDNNYKRLYNMTVTCLSEMATERVDKKYRGITVSAWQVIEKINLCLEDDEIGLTIRDFLYEFLFHYEHTKNMFEISKPIPYMKSMLWDYLTCYGE